MSIKQLSDRRTETLGAFREAVLASLSVLCAALVLSSVLFLI